MPIITLHAMNTVSVPRRIEVRYHRNANYRARTRTVRMIIKRRNISESRIRRTLSTVLSSTSCLCVILRRHLSTRSSMLRSLKVLRAISRTIRQQLALNRVRLSMLIPMDLVAIRHVRVVPCLHLTLRRGLQREIRNMVNSSNISCRRRILRRLIRIRLYCRVVLNRRPLTVIRLNVFLLGLRVLRPISN